MGSTLPPSPVAPFSPFFITSSRNSPRQLPTYLPTSATPPYTVVHLSFTRSLSHFLSLFPCVPPRARWPLTPCNNARVYTVCPHPPAYIFASYNIDYFGRISGRAARELRPFLRLEPSHRASPRCVVPTTPTRASHPRCARAASLQSISRCRRRVDHPPPPPPPTIRRRNADFSLLRSAIRPRPQFVTALRNTQRDDTMPRRSAGSRNFGHIRLNRSQERRG